MQGRGSNNRARRRIQNALSVMQRPEPIKEYLEKELSFICNWALE